MPETVKLGGLGNYRFLLVVGLPRVCLACHLGSVSMLYSVTLYLARKEGWLGSHFRVGPDHRLGRLSAAIFETGIVAHSSNPLLL